MKLQNEIPLICSIIQFNSTYYEYLSNELKENITLANTYLSFERKYEKIKKNLPKNLKVDVCKYLEKLLAIGYVEPFPQLIRDETFKQGTSVFLQYLKIEDLNDKEFMIPILKEYPSAFKLCRELKLDKEVIKMVLEKSEDFIELIDINLQKDDEILSILNKSNQIETTDTMAKETNKSTS